MLDIFQRAFVRYQWAEKTYRTRIGQISAARRCFTAGPCRAAARGWHHTSLAWLRRNVRAPCGDGGLYLCCPYMAVSEFCLSNIF
jgi:hypothetical protein